MEKHIFKFGQSSLAIILPKKWTEKRGLKAASSISLLEDETGDLRLTTKQVSRQEIERPVSQSMEPSVLGRWVGLDYMYGAGRVRLYSKEGLTHGQLESVETKVSGECPGFEITSQSNNDLVVEDLANVGEISIDKIVARLRSLIEQEFREFETGNLRTVAKIEKLVNRFYMLGVRYVNVTQAKDALKYLVVLEQLEELSDRLSDLSPDRSLRGDQVFAQLHEQFTLAFDGYAGNVKAIEKTAELRLRIRKHISSQKMGEFNRYLLMEATNSIARISEFGLKVSERPGEFTIPVSDAKSRP